MKSAQESQHSSYRMISPQVCDLGIRGLLLNGWFVSLYRVQLLGAVYYSLAPISAKDGVDAGSCSSSADGAETWRLERRRVVSRAATMHDLHYQQQINTLSSVSSAMEERRRKREVDIVHPRRRKRILTHLPLLAWTPYPTSLISDTLVP